MFNILYRFHNEKLNQLPDVKNVKLSYPQIHLLPMSME